MKAESRDSALGIITRSFLPLLAETFAGVPAGSLVLDVGCGDGRFAGEVPPHLKWVGLDLDLAQLRQGGDGARVGGVMERLPFADGSFGAVFSFSTLQYVDQHSALEEVSRVLRSGSPAVFFENLEGNPIARMHRRAARFRNRGQALATPKRHLRIEELGVFDEFLSVRSVQTLHLLTPLLFARPINRSSARLLPIAASVLGHLDGQLLRFESARRMAWMAAILTVKP